MNSSSPVEQLQAPDISQADDPLLECLVIICRIHDRPQSADGLISGLPLDGHRLTPKLCIRAAERQGFAARVLKRPLNKISSLVLPVILLLKDGSACVLSSLDARGNARIIQAESGAGERSLPVGELAQDYSGYCLFIQPRPRGDKLHEHPLWKEGHNWFWATLWYFRRYYGEAMLAAVVINVLTIATSLFIMNVYDRVVPNTALDTLYVLAAGTIMAIVFEFLARNLRGWFIDVAGKKADILLAARLFSHALGLRMDARPSSPGSFAAQLREFETLRDFITSATLTTLTDIPFIFFFIWVMSLIGGPLYLVPLIAVPLVVVIGLIAQLPLAWVMNKHLRETAMKHGLLVESVTGMETLKMLSAEGQMQSRWEEYTALTGQTATQSRFISSLVINSAMLIQQCSTIALVVWGVYLIGEGTISLGALIGCVILNGRGLAPLGQVAGLLARYQHARVAYHMLNELMKKPTDRDPGRVYLQRPELRGEIALVEVEFSYPDQSLPALNKVSFALEAGEHVAILGRIGSGKTTLLKLIAGLYRPTAGAVRIDGTDQQQFDPADLRRNMAYLEQDARLFHGSLRENITMGAPLADDQAILEAARLAGLDKLIEQNPMGFDLHITEGGEGLSGGQKQAVAIARALLKAAPILLFDEPTSSMDHSTEQAVIAGLREYSQGRTLVLVTHKPALLNLVDRIIVMDAGRVVMDGPREQVLKQLMTSA